MTIDPRIIDTICLDVKQQSVTALRAMRMTLRQARLAEPEILTPDQAELHDLNLLILSVVDEALPLSRALGIRAALQLDPRLPQVPMLVRPLEDALAAGLDLCLDATVSLLRVKTHIRRDRAVATFESLCHSDAFDAGHWDLDMSWQEAGAMGQVELMIGESASRALGGRLLLQRRAQEIRLSLELPITSRPQQGWVEGVHDPVKYPRRGYHFYFPGANPVPQMA